MGSLYESLPSLLAATVAVAIGMGVVLRDRGRDDFVLFALFCVNLGLYHLANFFAGTSGVAMFDWGAQTISLVLPFTADRCFASFVTADAPTRGRRIRSGLLLLIVGAHTLAFFVLVGRSPGDGVMDEAPWKWISLGLNAYVILGLLLAASRFWRASRDAAETVTAPRMRYLFYASLVALALGSPLIPTVGPIVTATYLYFVAQTLMRERLLDLPELISRVLTLALLVTAVSAMYALLLLWIPPDVEGASSLFVFNIAVASYAVIVLIDPVRQEFESRVESWLMRDKFELRRMLVQLRFKLLNVIDENELVDVVMQTLEDSNRVTRARFFVMDSLGRRLILRGQIGEGAPQHLDAARRRPLLDRMRGSGAQLRDVMQRERDRPGADHAAELDDALSTLAELGASLAVPIVAPRDDATTEPELMGALFVDDERLLEPFSSEEVELFEGLAAQAAITLRNSAAYEGRKERERLAALGEMAAGLAHEIRNPLGAIKGAVQVVEGAAENVDPTTGEFLSVIVQEVDRLNRVVTQFLRYSRPFSGELALVDVSKVIEATLRLIPSPRGERVSVTAPLADGESAPVRGDDEALRQVFHNLVLNALDATEESDPPGRVWIEVERRHRGLPGGDALAISVCDDGPGFSTQTMSNLFVPFHTTKSGGTGLGLPISQRIVENHQGLIEVSSTDAGARFTVVLPMESA